MDRELGVPNLDGPGIAAVYGCVGRIYPGPCRRTRLDLPVGVCCVATRTAIAASLAAARAGDRAVYRGMAIQHQHHAGVGVARHRSLAVLAGQGAVKIGQELFELGLDRLDEIFAPDAEPRLAGGIPGAGLGGSTVFQPG